MSRRTKMTEDILEMMKNPTMVRNIGFIGHIDHGKTTLSDSLLAKAGLLSESLAGEARVLDFLNEEQRRGITMKSANISLYYESTVASSFDKNEQEKNDSSRIKEEEHGYLINLVDTPGHLDFSGKVTRALRLIDGVVVIVDAVEEISSQTETVVRQALEEAARPILFINKIDRLFKELRLDMDQIKEKISRIITDFNHLITIYGDKKQQKNWMVSAERGTVIFGSALHKWGFSIPQLLRNKKTMKYFQEKYLSNKYSSLQKSYPVWECVLNAAVKFLPNPIDAQKYRIDSIWKGDLNSEIGESMKKCDPAGPLVICLSKVQKMKNRLIGTGRVFSGSIDLKDRVYLINAEKKTYIQQLSIFMGSRLETVKNIPAGNIVAIGGIDEIRSGETIIGTKTSKDFTPFESVKYITEPVLTVSVEPNMLKDLDTLESHLEDIRIEDPNIIINISKDTGEVLVSGMGPLHLEVISNMISERGVDITVSEPTSVFYNSVSKRSKIITVKSPNNLNQISLMVERQKKENLMFFKTAEKRILKNKYLLESFLKQNTDFREDEIKGFLTIDRYHNMVSYCDCSLPDEKNHNIKSIEEEFGIEIQKNLIQVFHNLFKSGHFAKEPFSELKVSICDLIITKEYEEDNFFELATMIQNAFNQCLETAYPILIEPIYFMIITCPGEYIGKVSSLINQHQGKILVIKNKDYNAEINAKMCVRKSILFSQDVRSKTSGKVFWNSIFDSFEEVPPGEFDQIVQNIKFKKGLF